MNEFMLVQPYSAQCANRVGSLAGLDSVFRLRCVLLAQVFCFFSMFPSPICFVLFDWYDYELQYQERLLNVMLQFSCIHWQQSLRR